MNPININLTNIEFAQDTCKLMAGFIGGEAAAVGFLFKIIFPILLCFIIWRLFDYLKFKARLKEQSK